VVTKGSTFNVLWAAEIGGDGLRESAMVRVGARYFQQEPSAAAAWLESSGLPDSTLREMKPSIRRVSHPIRSLAPSLFKESEKMLAGVSLVDKEF
jgi:hypothetical protein